MFDIDWHEIVPIFFFLYKYSSVKNMEKKYICLLNYQEYLSVERKYD